MINFLNLKNINAQYRDDLLKAATDIIDSGWYIQGPQVEEFERQKENKMLDMAGQRKGFSDAAIDQANAQRDSFITSVASSFIGGV